MGVVYRCRHNIIDREYALKILKPSQINEQRWQRFQVEARSIAKLDHPNIVKIFNMGIDGGDCPYYVMELLDGESLEQYIGTELLSNLNTTFDLFKQLASGLGYAHSKGIIHRDIKPDNIVIEKDSSGFLTAKIVDFGIAKLLHRDTLMKQGLTSAGQVFGTPLYMSPEQSQGGEIDQRSDIYSLGCTFFKTLTGKFPFLGKSAMETVMMHQSDQPPTLMEVSGYNFPQDLEDIVQRMIAKHPDDRYQTMEQVAHDIERMAQGKTLAKMPLSRTDSNMNVETGERSTGSQRNSGTFKTRLSIGIISLLTVAMAVGGYLYYLYHHPSASDKTGNSSSTAGGDRETIPENIPQNTFANEAETAAATTKSPTTYANIEKERNDFAAFVPKPCETFTENGKPKIRFYFPNSPVGKLHNKSSGYSEARGTVVMDDEKPFMLEIREKDQAVWAFPSILEKLDNANINELLFTRAVMADDKADREQPILEMLSRARRWKNFCGIHFIEFFPGNKALDFAATFPHLSFFSLSNGTGTGKDLANRPFLKQLTTLDVSAIKDVDAILRALENAPQLSTLVISETDPSPAALRKLQTCPKLEYLTFSDSRVSTAQLDAISKIQTIENLSLRGSHLSPQDLLHLRGLKKFKQLFIDHWTAEDTAAFNKFFPRCNVLKPGEDVNKGYAKDFGI